MQNLLPIYLFQFLITHFQDQVKNIMAHAGKPEDDDMNKALEKARCVAFNPCNVYPCNMASYNYLFYFMLGEEGCS